MLRIRAAIAFVIVIALMCVAPPAVAARRRAPTTIETSWYHVSEPVTSGCTPLVECDYMALTATLTTDTGEPLAGRHLSFLIDGQVVCLETTSDSGHAECRISDAERNTTYAAAESWTASFDGDKRFAPSTATDYLPPWPPRLSGL